MFHNHKKERLKQTVKLFSKTIKLNNFPSAIKSLQKVETSANIVEEDLRFDARECTIELDLSYPVRDNYTQVNVKLFIFYHGLKNDEI